MTSETDKELLLRVAQAVCHEEQMTVWSGDFATALGANGYLCDLSYDEVVELHQTIQLELQRIIASAMQHPEASRVLREAAEGGRSLDWVEWAPNIERWVDPGCMPVAEGTVVDVQYRDGQYGHGLTAGANMDGKSRDAGPAFWRPDGQENDIVRWRLCPPSPEPATHSLEGDR